MPSKWLANFEVRSPQVISDAVDGVVLAINMDTGDYYTFNESGSQIWSALCLPSDARPEMNDVDPQVGGRFCEDLLAAGLVRTLDASLPREPVESASRDAARGDGDDVNAPSFQRHGDLADIIALDPIHDVDPTQGWPMPNPERPNPKQ